MLLKALSDLFIHKFSIYVSGFIWIFFKFINNALHSFYRAFLASWKILITQSMTYWCFSSGIRVFVKTTNICTLMTKRRSSLKNGRKKNQRRKKKSFRGLTLSPVDFLFDFLNFIITSYWYLKQTNLALTLYRKRLNFYWTKCNDYAISLQKS